LPEGEPPPERLERVHPVVDAHQPQGESVCRNAQSLSSRTGRTSGLPSNIGKLSLYISIRVFVEKYF
jgi:hypothetical protein